VNVIPKPVPSELPDDAALARRLVAGDASAFEPVMRRHNQMLYRLARSILRDDAEAEDAVQEAYLSAFRHIGSYRGDAALSTWLARIVVNESYGRLRKRKSAIVVSFEGTRADNQESEEADVADDTTERPDAAAHRGELRALLERRIDGLPEQFRTVFVLREVQELTVDETAACLAIPAATVRTRTFRARALLRESLARDLDLATPDAFGFDGERCDRIVAQVLARLQS
jgi:RNA polymerase sigma-70 factor (ECF subfamily)